MFCKLALFICALPFLFSACATTNHLSQTVPVPAPSLSPSQAARVNAVVTRWNSTALGEVETRLSPEPSSSTDESGLCLAVEGHIELNPQAFEFSDEAFNRCMSLAAVQNRYDEIEGRWLKELNEHEAWIPQDGLLSKVSVSDDGRLEEPAARLLWASLATRELLLELGDASSSQRAIASEPSLTTPSDPTDATVRELLGFKSELLQNR